MIQVKERSTGIQRIKKNIGNIIENKFTQLKNLTNKQFHNNLYFFFTLYILKLKLKN